MGIGHQAEKADDVQLKRPVAFPLLPMPSLNIPFAQLLVAFLVAYPKRPRRLRRG